MGLCTVRSGLASLALGTVLGCGTRAGSSNEATLLEGRSNSSAASVLEVLDGESRSALARAPFAVLVFPQPWRSTVMSGAEGERWVAVRAEGDGVRLSLHGTDVAHADLSEEEVARIPTPSTRVRGGPAWLTLNEQIRSVAFHEGPVAWSLEVECDRPFEDPRCTGTEFALALAESLVTVQPNRERAR